MIARVFTPPAPSGRGKALSLALIKALCCFMHLDYSCLDEGLEFGVICQVGPLGASVIEPNQVELAIGA